MASIASGTSEFVQMAFGIPEVSKNSKTADLIFGSIAGIAGKLIEYPFDTVKVRLQTQTLGQYQGPSVVIAQIAKEEGLNGFYRGLSAPLIGSMMENSVLFLSYNSIQKLLKTHHDDSLSLSQLTLAGFLSGACVSFVLTPVELIKCRLQTTSAFKGPMSFLIHMVRNQGISALYRGHFGTLLRESFGGAAWFGTYELAVNQFIQTTPGAKTKEDLSTWKLMIAGALSGISYNAALFPADTIKSRQQAFEKHEPFFKVARDLHRIEGIRGFFRGFGITIARSAPTSAVIFASYEWLNKNIAIE